MWILEDASLTMLALAVAPAAGVILAVVVSIFIFMHGRLAQNERDAVKQARSAADRVYGIILSSGDRTGRYLGVAPPAYEAFVHLVTSLSRVDSSDDIPDFIDWRTQTGGGVTLASLGHGDNIQSMDDSTRKLHTDFVDAMHELDSVIRFKQSSVTVARQSILVVHWAARLSAAGLIASIVIILSSSGRYGTGIDDSWNWLPALLLLALTLASVLLLLSITRLIGRSGGKIIESLAARHISNLREKERKDTEAKTDDGQDDGQVVHESKE